MLSDSGINSRMCVLLTVGAAVHLHSEAHPAAGVPVARDEAQETCSHWVGQLVLDDGLRIRIPDKSLREQGGTKIAVMMVA